MYAWHGLVWVELSPPSPMVRKAGVKPEYEAFSAGISRKFCSAAAKNVLTTRREREGEIEGEADRRGKL